MAIETILARLSAELVEPELAAVCDDCWWERMSMPWRVVAALGRFDDRVLSAISQADAEGFVIDRHRRMILHKSARVHSTSVIDGPIVVDADAEIGPNCRLRGGVIVLRGTVVGHGAEVKDCVVRQDSFLNHFCYAGYSIIGARCSFSAGVIAAGARLDEGPIVAGWGGRRHSTGMIKYGAAIGDRVRLGVGTLIMPGAAIAPGTMVLPGTIVRGEYPAKRVS